MALDFDQFPLRDPIAKNTKGELSDVWELALGTFFETLVTYLTSGGIILPNLTDVQQAKILNPANGQMVYNLKVDAPQFYQTSTKTWRTINFT